MEFKSTAFRYIVSIFIYKYITTLKYPWQSFRLVYIQCHFPKDFLAMESINNIFFWILVFCIDIICSSDPLPLERFVCNSNVHCTYAIYRFAKKIDLQLLHCQFNTILKKCSLYYIEIVLYCNCILNALGIKVNKYIIESWGWNIFTPAHLTPLRAIHKLRLQEFLQDLLKILLYRREQNFTHPISKALQWLAW